MIKLNEFRIGNMVLFEGKPTQITINSFKRLLDFDSESDYEGITLTPEILEMMPAFKKCRNYKSEFPLFIYESNLADCVIQIKADKVFLREYNSGTEGTYFISIIKYLHELQNLILDLTKEELVIKELQTA